MLAMSHCRSTARQHLLDHSCAGRASEGLDVTGVSRRPWRRGPRFQLVAPAVSCPSERARPPVSLRRLSVPNVDVYAGA
eukprot:8180590-Pyramimonas_sp.AAC.1